MAYGKIKADTLVYDNSGSDVEVTLSSLGNKANLASPTFTGTVTIPTPSSGDNTTKAASTAFVVAGFAPKASPTFTGTINGAALTLSGDLTVQGTTTTISSTTIDVADKNIELGKVSTPTDTTADGGGITLKGATDKTFNWTNSIDAWSSSEHIKLSDDKKLYLGASEDLQLYHDGSHSYIKEAGTGNLILRTNYLDINNADGSEDMAKFISDGGVHLYHNNVKKIETTAAGVTVTGTVTDTKGELRNIPKLVKSSQHALVASDAGQCCYSSSGGFVINSSILSAGDAVTLINNSGSDMTITQGSGVTMYNTADAATGNRTLAGRGMATVWFADNATVYISGAGLS